MEEATLTALKAEHGEVTTLTALGYEIVVKNPTPEAFDRFMATTAKGKEHANRAFRNLLVDCIVHPARADVDAMLVRRPGLAVTFGSEVAKIAGLVDEVEAKKA